MTVWVGGVASGVVAVSAALWYARHTRKLKYGGTWGWK